MNLGSLYAGGCGQENVATDGVARSLEHKDRQKARDQRQSSMSPIMSLNDGGLGDGRVGGEVSKIEAARQNYLEGHPASGNKHHLSSRAYFHVIRW
jgi:hypothetical protein